MELIFVRINHTNNTDSFKAQKLASSSTIYYDQAYNCLIHYYKRMISYWKEGSDIFIRHKFIVFELIQL